MNDFVKKWVEANWGKHPMLPEEDYSYETVTLAEKLLTDFSAALVAKILKDMPWNVMPCGCDKKSRRPKEGPHCNQEGRYAALCEVRDFLEGLSQFK